MVLMSKFGKGLKTVSSASCTGGKESDMPYHTGSKKNGGKKMKKKKTGKKKSSKKGMR